MATTGGGGKDYIKAYNLAFNIADARDISKVDIRLLLGTTARALSGSEMQSLIDVFDTDGNGRIDFTEFLSMLNAGNGLITADKLAQLTKMLELQSKGSKKWGTHKAEESDSSEEDSEDEQKEEEEGDRDEGEGAAAAGNATKPAAKVLSKRALRKKQKAAMSAASRAALSDIEAALRPQDAQADDDDDDDDDKDEDDDDEDDDEDSSSASAVAAAAAYSRKHRPGPPGVIVGSLQRAGL